MFFATVTFSQATTLPDVLAVGPVGENWQALVTTKTPVQFHSEALASGYAEAQGIYLDKGVVVNVYIHPGKDTLNSAQVRDYFYETLYADDSDVSEVKKSVDGRRGRMNFWMYQQNGITTNKYVETVSMSRGSWRIHFEISRANMLPEFKKFLSDVAASCSIQDTPKGVAVSQRLALEGLEYWNSKVDGKYRLTVSKSGGVPAIVVRDNETGTVVLESTKYTRTKPAAGALTDKLNSIEGTTDAISESRDNTDFAWVKSGSKFKAIANNGKYEMYITVHSANADLATALLKSLAGN